MKRRLLGLGLGLGLWMSAIAPVLAVQPASISASDNVAWSKVVDNPFDGKVVYDRNYKDDFVLVSSWSKNGIGVTYIRLHTTLIGYDSYYSHHRRWFDPFLDETPIYRQYAVDSAPDSISLAINGKIYTYESGPVSPDLAAALASAPSGKVPIRLVWRDGRTKDTEIGKDTVKAWKTIFQPS